MGGANKLRVTAADSVVPVLGSGVDITCKRKDESICISIFKKNINFEMNLKDANIEINLILL